MSEIDLKYANFVNFHKNMPNEVNLIPYIIAN